VNTPTMAKTNANTTAMRPAMRVALTYGRPRASSARRIRPPSIGNDGRRSNTARTAFAIASQPKRDHGTASDRGTAGSPT